MKLFGREVEAFYKILVVLVATLLIASGLCGGQIAILDLQRGGLNDLTEIFSITGLVELVAIFFSLVGILIWLIVWFIRKIHNPKEVRPTHDPGEDKKNSADRVGPGLEI